MRLISDDADADADAENATECCNPAIQCQNNMHRRKRKTMWVYPRLQFWFEQLVVNRYQRSSVG